MKELSVSDSISQGWDFAKKHGLLLAAFLFVFAIITGVINSLTVPSGFWESYMAAITNPQDTHAMERLMAASSASTSLNSIVSLIINVLMVLFMAGFCTTIIRLVRGTMEKVSFEGFKIPAMTYLKYFVVCLIVGFSVVVGTFLCIIPGIFLAVRLAFADWYILDHPEAGIGEAISASWKMTKGNFWSVFGLQLCEIGIVLIGFLCCCIGLYFAIPFAYFAESCAYTALHENLDYENLETAPVNEYQKDEH